MIAGKRKLCYTEVSDFTNIQGVGNDPIYKRYNSVYAIIRQYIKEEYQSFLSEPEYSEDEDRVYWYVDEWSDDITPIKLQEIDSTNDDTYKKLLNDIVEHYTGIINSLSGDKKNILESAIKYIDEQFIYCVGNKLVLAVWGMHPDKYRHNSSGIVIHEFEYTDYSVISFNTGKFGVLSNKLESKLKRKKGSILTRKDLPEVVASEGYEFLSWEPNPIGVEITKNLSFTATYKKNQEINYFCNVKFIGDENCDIEGIDVVELKKDTTLTHEQIPNVKLKDGFSFVGWDHDISLPINSDIVFQAITDKAKPEVCHVKFVSSDAYELIGPQCIDIEKGCFIPKEQIPDVKCHTGYKFIAWSEDITASVNKDLEIHAECTKDEISNINVNFNSGDNGILNGASTITLPIGSKLNFSQIPKVKANSGFKFIGWDKSPLDIILNEDIIFNALYERDIPWWKRTWLWLMSLGGCLMKLLVFLFLLLLFLFLLSLVRRCDNEKVLASGDIYNGPALVEPGDSIHHHFKDIPGYADDGLIGDHPSTPIDNPDLGEGIEPGNGENDYHVGILPRNPGIPPIDNPDNPQGPQIIPNIINIFFTDDNANLNAFAKDFRDIYPDTQKYLLDYDDLVKRISIMMPVEERVSMKREIERKLSEKYSFFIVDEFAIQQGNFVTAGTGSVNSETYAGWHLLAVNAPKAWAITVGDSNITVAVVDDGFDTTHDFLKDKIISPYNVFTKNQELTKGSGHGTHTAGLAVGLVRADGKAAGIAPGCKLMPIQVFHENQSTISAEISGIAYAIHNGADVVNISMGCSYAGFRNIPTEEQLAIAQQKGRVEELLWQRVFRMAKERNTVLVFSAGNDNVVSYLNPQNRPDSLISVTAVDRRLQKSIFGNDGAGSDYGIGSTIAAPGSEIFSSVPVNDYAMMQGTSMAAPIVTGVVALLKSMKKDITIGETIDILKKSGRQLSDVSLGPLVQADRALVLLQTGTLPIEDDESGSEDNNNQSRDYSAIFRQIAEHQKAIVDLIKQLPPEEQKKLDNKKE